MKRIILTLSVVILSAFACQPVYACTCLEAKGPILDANGKPVKIDPEVIKKWWLENFRGAVFIGRVSKIEKVKVKQFDHLKRKRKVTVDVERAWLGVNDPSFVIY